MLLLGGLPLFMLSLFALGKAGAAPQPTTPAQTAPEVEAADTPEWAEAWGREAALAVREHRFMDLITRGYDFERFCVRAFDTSYTEMSPADQAATRTRVAVFFVGIYAQPQINLDMAQAGLEFGGVRMGEDGIAQVQIEGEGDLGMTLHVVQTPGGVRIIDMERMDLLMSEVYADGMVDSGVSGPLEFTGLIAGQLSTAFSAPSAVEP